MTATAAPTRTIPKLWAPGRHKKPEAGQTVRAAVYASARMATAGERAPNGETFDVHIIAATQHVARDHGVIEVGAWKRDISLYRQNPVVMWAHDYQKPPIATSIFDRINEATGQLEQFWRFLDGLTDDEHDRFAARVKALYAVGGMRCASVGWLTHEVRDPTFKEKADALTRGEPELWWVVTRAELMEVSAVPVPSDPYAVQVERAIRDAGKKGVDVAPLIRAWNDARKPARDLPSTLSTTDPKSVAYDPPPAAGVTEEDTEMKQSAVVEAVAEASAAASAAVAASAAKKGVKSVGIKGVLALAAEAFAASLAREPAGQGISSGHPGGEAVVGDVDPTDKALAGALVVAAGDAVEVVPAPGDFGGSVQSLIFPKAHWSGPFQVQYWAVVRGWKHIAIEETTDAWVLPQRAEGDFFADTFILTCLTGAPYESPNDRVCRIRARLGSLAVAPDDPDHKPDQGATVESEVEPHPGNTDLATDGGVSAKAAPAPEVRDDLTDEDALFTVMEAANHDAEAALEALFAPSAAPAAAARSEDTSAGDDDLLDALAQLAESEPDTVRAVIRGEVDAVLQARFGVLR